MMRLFVAELRRLLARRMTRFFPLALALLMLGGIVIAGLVIGSNDDDTVDFVQDFAGGEDARSMFELVANLLPIMAFVIGASFFGADAKTGMLEQILTWEPRRFRLLIARAAATLVGVGIVAALLAAWWIVITYGMSAAVGTVDGTTSTLWQNVAVGLGRTALAVGLFAVFGLGVTALVNNSVGSIVGFLIYWFILESFIISAFLPRIAVFLPIVNAGAFGSGRDVERIEGGVFTADGPTLVTSHGPGTAGVYLALWVALGLALGTVAFLRRDID